MRSRVDGRQRRWRDFKTSTETDIVPQLMTEFGYNNVMQVPKLEKIVVNIGLGEAVQNAKAIDAAVGDLTQITGQKPVVTRAKKSIAAFKLRAGMPIGAMVTLRGERMYEFLDRLVAIALPRIRDFRGVSPNSFDGRGNYTLGLREQIHVPGDRLRQDRQDARARSQHRDHRAERRRRPAAARAARHAVRKDRA